MYHSLCIPALCHFQYGQTSLTYENVFGYSIWDQIYSYYKLNKVNTSVSFNWSNIFLLFWKKRTKKERQAGAELFHAQVKLGIAKLNWCHLPFAYNNCVCIPFAKRIEVLFYFHIILSWTSICPNIEVSFRFS